uniref:Outer membrane lipoprotein-sorting protein n=1 Tax=candidate division WOR-3 bacterium TaxID=2052148 RepID=A0A7V3KMJ5_UNCW3
MNIALIITLLFQQISPSEVLLSLRKNLKYTTSTFSAQLEIRKGKRVLNKSFKGYSKGENFYLEFTNPEDKGVKYLKFKGDLYIYLPDIDDVVRLSGDMLKQSFMGSDLSYEDLMQEDPLKYYKPVSMRDTTLEGKIYFILELEDTTGNAPYYRARMVVDLDRNIWLKEELITKSGRKIKEVEALEFKNIKGKHYPTSIAMRDLRLKDSYTKFVFKEVDFDIPIPDKYFSLSELKK